MLQRAVTTTQSVRLQLMFTTATVSARTTSSHTQTHIIRAVFTYALCNAHPANITTTSTRMQATGTLQVQATEPPLVSDHEYETDSDSDNDNNNNNEEKPKKKRKRRNRQTVLSFNLQDFHDLIDIYNLRGQPSAVPARPDKEYYDPLKQLDPVEKEQQQQQQERTGRQKTVRPSETAETVEISSDESDVEESKGGD
jgi:hypothetical protein